MSIAKIATGVAKILSNPEVQKFGKSAYDSSSAQKKSNWGFYVKIVLGLIMLIGIIVIIVGETTVCKNITTSPNNSNNDCQKYRISGITLTVVGAVLLLLMVLFG